MLSELRQKKMSKWFEAYDRDGDGVITKDDFEQRITDLYVQGLGVGRDTPQYERVRDSELAFWYKVRDASGTDDDGRVTREEFVSSMAQLMSEEGKFEPLATAAIENFLAANDTDGDGRISLDEYVRSLASVPTNSKSDLEYGFHQLDVDGSGDLSNEELRQSFHDYCFSDDPDPPGNRMFGPLD